MTKKDQEELEEVQKERDEQLSAWQIRNKEYLEKKALKDAEQQKELEEKKKFLLGAEEEEADSEEEDVSEESEETDSDTDEEPAAVDDLHSEEAEEEVPTEELSDKEQKKLEKAQRKAEKKNQKIRTAPIHILRALPVLLISFFLVLLAAYFLSPLSKIKELQVTGNKEVQVANVLADSKINDRDYTVTTYLNGATYAQNIKNASPWIEDVQISYQFPAAFTIKISEYDVAAYESSSGAHYPVLTNGVLIDQEVAEENLPEKYMSLNFSDKDQIKKFVQQLAEIEDSIKSNIQSVDLTPSQATDDLLTLNMYDGNKIIVPLSQIARKLPYYSKIQTQLKGENTVDMEAGIFSYANN